MYESALKRLLKSRVFGEKVWKWKKHTGENCGRGNAHDLGKPDRSWCVRHGKGVGRPEEILQKLLIADQVVCFSNGQGAVGINGYEESKETFKMWRKRVVGLGKRPYLRTKEMSLPSRGTYTIPYVSRLLKLQLLSSIFTPLQYFLYADPNALFALYIFIQRCPTVFALDGII